GRRLARRRPARAMGVDRDGNRADRGARCAGQRRLAARLAESRFPVRRTAALLSRVRAGACGRTYLLARSQRPHGGTVRVTDGGVTLGIGLTGLSEVEDPDAATIRMLGVSPGARGRGIGEALVRACVETARKSGQRRVRLDTRTSMASAQRLYERLGFRREPE